ncbi:MAG: phosphoribosylglycinamide formyltransferase [Chitinophagales bacterium]
MIKKRIAIFISGRGSNMEAIVRQAQIGILKDCCEVVLVFANKREAKGLETANQMNIATASIVSKGKKRRDFDQKVLDFIRPYHIDYIVLAGFMRIISPIMISEYPNRIINIHPADTKEFKGLGAYEWAFENQLESTKITVHYVDSGVDTGNIIEQQTVDLKGTTTLEEIEVRGLQVEHRFYSEVLQKVFSTVS